MKWIKFDIENQPSEGCYWFIFSWPTFDIDHDDYGMTVGVPTGETNYAVGLAEFLPHDFTDGSFGDFQFEHIDIGSQISSNATPVAYCPLEQPSIDCELTEFVEKGFQNFRKRGLSPIEPSPTKSKDLLYVVNCAGDPAVGIGSTYEEITVSVQSGELPEYVDPDVDSFEEALRKLICEYYDTGSVTVTTKETKK